MEYITEIRTLKDYDDNGTFDDYRIGNGWEVLSVQYVLFPHPHSQDIEDARHMRYVTITRKVSIPDDTSAAA